MLIGHYIQMADAEDDWRPIPRSEQVAVPSYLHSREDIDAEAEASLSCADNHDRAFKEPARNACGRGRGPAAAPLP